MSYGRVVELPFRFGRPVACSRSSPHLRQFLHRRTDGRGGMSEVLEKQSWAADLRVLWRLLAHPIRGKTHAERLESFYRDQARDYDSFRARMLHGRRELIESIDFPIGGRW